MTRKLGGRQAGRGGTGERKNLELTGKKRRGKGQEADGQMTQLQQEITAGKRRPEGKKEKRREKRESEKEGRTPGRLFGWAVRGRIYTGVSTGERTVRWKLGCHAIWKNMENMKNIPWPGRELKLVCSNALTRFCKGIQCRVSMPVYIL